MNATETPSARAPSHCCFVQVRRWGLVNTIKTTAPKKKRQALVADGPIWPKTRDTIAADHWINDAPNNMYPAPLTTWDFERVLS